MAATWRLAHAVRDALNPDGLNLVQANGRAGFQDVFHFHMHVLPRYDGDGIIRPWESTPGDRQEIRTTAEAIRAAV